MPRIIVDAFKCEQNGKNFYVARINSSYLKKMCFVTRKKEDIQKGFQRVLNSKRAKDIAKYLDIDKGIIPSSIIVSAQPAAQLEYDEKKKQLSFFTAEKSLLVIDGQHRLYGLSEATFEYDMPVVIFYNLSTSDEVKLFIDINTNQKGVPVALILDIKSQAGTETPLEEKQRRLFDYLNKNSVLAGYLSPSESVTGKISRYVFNNATKPFFENSRFPNEDSIYKSITNYLTSVDHVFKESGSLNARLTKSVLFKAVMVISDEVFDMCLSKYGNLKVESLNDCLSPLSKLQYDEYIGTNKQTETKIVNDMKNILRDPIVNDEDMF